MVHAFWCNQVIKAVILYGLAYLTGLWVQKANIKVNYTRKINHFALFFLPYVLMRLNPYEATMATTVAGSLIGTLTLAIYIRPLRNHTPIIGTMFTSFDRPEDRPLTLFWLSTQVIASYAVIVFLAVFVLNERSYEFVFIPILINGVGDGLAEPIGIRFGKHRYRTRALFTKKTYTRSLEGSACVFITSLIAILLFLPLFEHAQFIAALLIIPVVMTLAEAFSPHSWDSPFLLLAGGVSLAGILHYV